MVGVLEFCCGLLSVLARAEVLNYKGGMSLRERLGANNIERIVKYLEIKREIRNVYDINVGRRAVMGQEKRC